MALLTLAGCNKQPPKHVHTYDLEHPEWVWTESAGDYTATATIKCTSCKETREGHFVVLDANVTHQQTLDPTCTTPGEVTYTAVATYEETELRDTKVVSISSDSEAHHYVEAVAEQYLKTAATCTEDAVYYKSCQYCGLASTETFVAQGTALGHSKEHLDAKEATCTEDGWIEHWYCRRCGHYFLDEECTQVVTITDVVIPAAHQYVEAVGDSHLKTAATCTEDAVYYKSCKFCHENSEETFVDEGSKLGHELQHIVYTPSSCTDIGWIEHWRCYRCGKYFLDEDGTQEIAGEDTVIPLAAHDMTHSPEVPATCTSAGVREYWQCANEVGVFFKDELGNERYDSQYDLIINELGHNMAHHEAVEPSCTAEGNIEYWSCDRCGKLFLDADGQNECTAQDLVVPMAGHDYVNSAVTDKIGYFESKCSACELSNGLTSDLMTLADVDFTQAQYGAHGGKWGDNVQPTNKTMVFEVTDGGVENEIFLPKINFNLYKIVKFIISGNDWSARVGLESGNYAFPYAYRAEPYSGELTFVTEGNQVKAVLSCAEGTTQNIVITDSDILNGNKSVSLFMIADSAYRSITAELYTLTDSCEHDLAVSTIKLGAKECSICGDEANYVNELSDVDFTVTQYGAHGGKWGDNVQPTAKTMMFEALKNEEGVIYLPRINFNALGFVQFSVTCGSFAIEAGLDSGSYVLPILADTSAKSTGVLTLTLNSANQLVETLTCNGTSGYQQKIIDDVEVINGNESVCLYMLCPDYEWQTVTCELTALAASCEHSSYVVNDNCLGKEVCTICGDARGVSPTIDFTQATYGAYDIYLPMGDYEQEGWMRVDSATQISYANYQAGGLCKYHLPRMFFAGFSSISIDVTVANNLVVYALDESFASSYTTSSEGYSLKIVFENITSTSMDVKILDADGITQVQTTCTAEDVLNGYAEYVLYVQGSGNVGWDAFSNFTFVA